jgi:hypothetical protein
MSDMSGADMDAFVRAAARPGGGMATAEKA